MENLKATAQEYIIDKDIINDLSKGTFRANIIDLLTEFYILGRSDEKKRQEDNRMNQGLCMM